MSHKSKLASEQHGPGWLEIIFGAGLCLALGVVLGAAHLVFKPVQKVNELPKDAPVSLLYPPVYFIEGATSGGSAWKSKQQAFLSGTGGAITLSEQELNAFVAAAAPPPAPVKPPAPAATTAPADKTKPTAAAYTVATLGPGVINFRLHDNELQAAMAGNFHLVGLGIAPLVQIRGNFAKGADGFALQPDEFYLGSLPLHKITGLSGWLFKKMLGAQTGVPAELQAAWQKLGNVAVNGDQLTLTLTP